MSALLSLHVIPWLLSYLLNALWQAPLIALAAWLAARMLHRAGTRIEHRIWVGALLLEVALPACDFHVASVWKTLLALLRVTRGPVDGGGVRVILGPATPGSSALHLPAALFLGIAFGYVCVLFYFAGRLVWGLSKTHSIAQAATPVLLPTPAAVHWRDCVRRFGISTPPGIAGSPHVIGPVTVGLHAGIVLVPPAFIERISDEDLNAVLAHELAHIRRQDFFKNLLYELVSLPIVWHPLLWWTRMRLAESRELVCDAMAADAVAGRKQYARSLLRLASLLTGSAPVPTLHAIGMLDAHTFERRIMTLSHKPTSMGAARRFLLTAACSVLAIGTCATAFALHMSVGTTATAAQTGTPKVVKVKSGDMAGNKISGQNPTYPPEAKAKKIQGTVVLDATISKDGAIEHLKVQKSPSELLSKSSIDAVQTWQYRPYLLNGEPVEVTTTINVTYNLGK